MPQTTRTFVAIPVPGDKARKLERLQQLLAAELPGVRWVDPGHFHLTLAFLGDVDVADLDKVCRAAGEAAATFAPIDLVIEGPGAFPNPSRPRTLWVGLTGPGLGDLGRLQEAVAGAVRR